MRGSVWKLAVLVVGGLAVGADTARAQLTTTATSTNKQLGSARIIEWDLPVSVDFNPGAMVVDTRGEDNNTIWFVTRFGGQKVYRFNLQSSLMKSGGPARWTSWELVPDTNAGGIKKLRPSHDRRFVVVRTPSSIQEVDTQACVAGTPDYPTTCASGLRRWDFPDAPELFEALVSDVAVDDSRRIFTTGTSTSFFPDGYVQMLVPTKVPFTSSTEPIPAPAGTVTRWNVPGVGQCNGISGETSGSSLTCNSGVDFRSSNQNLVYLSNQGLNSIDELNVSTNAIRRWVLPDDSSGLPVRQPRMLKIDSNDTVWVITGSGHLVSLNPKNSSGCPSGKNKITRHRLPENVGSDGWGIAPDSNVVGYTDANNHKVGMLVPRDAAVCQAPILDSAPRQDILATVTTAQTHVVSDIVRGDPKTVLRETTKKDDGTFVEAVINQPAPGSTDPFMKMPNSMMPLGISPVKSKAQGTYFYAVGLTAGASADPNLAFGPDASVAKRIGFVRLGIPERIKNPRDDDDDDDGYQTTNTAWRVGSAGDMDGDGVPDEYDTSTSRDNATFADAAILPVAQIMEYPVSTTATTLALIAAATPDILTATISVDVYNSLGTLVGSSGPIVGAAVATIATPAPGNYTVRVRNLSTLSVAPAPALVVREPATIQQ